MKFNKIICYFIVSILLLASILPFAIASSKIIDISTVPKFDGTYYSYCPSVINDNGKSYIYYCANSSNKNTGRIIDEICLRIEENGSFSDEIVCLSPTDDSTAWDSLHICDPSVIRGDFVYRGDSYTWLMAYLGCKYEGTNDTINNNVGLAVSNDGINWTKVNYSVPFVHYSLYDSYGSWGVGQPCLVYANGEVALLYCAQSHTWISRIPGDDLNDITGGIDAYMISDIGTIRSDNTMDRICNADFALGSNGYMYMVCDQHGGEWFPYSPSGMPVPIKSIIYRTPFSDYYDLQNCIWEIADVIESDADIRCHNAGFERNKYGNIYNIESPIIYYTKGIETYTPFPSALWTYTINKAYFKPDSSAILPEPSENAPLTENLESNNTENTTQFEDEPESLKEEDSYIETTENIEDKNIEDIEEDETTQTYLMKESIRKNKKLPEDIEKQMTISTLNTDDPEELSPYSPLLYIVVLILVEIVLIWSRKRRKKVLSNTY